MGDYPYSAELGLNGWAGLTWTPCLVVGETPKRYRIKAIQRMKLSGRDRWIEAGETALVPKTALRRTTQEKEKL